jgi:nicotinamidase-related amidase
MTIPEQGYRFPPEQMRRGRAMYCCPRRHPSAFFGTPLASYFIDLRVDTLVVTGCTTSGCVRGSVVDAFAYNFKVLCRGTRCTTAASIHAVNLLTCRRSTPT